MNLSRQFPQPSTLEQYCHQRNIGIVYAPAAAATSEAPVLFAFHGHSGTAALVARTLNACETTGKTWAKSGTLVGTLYPSKTGTPFVSVIYPGPHMLPAEAPALVVKFFKEQADTKAVSTAVKPR